MVKKYRISDLFKKLNKKKGPSEDPSIPLRRGNKIIIEGRGRDLVRKSYEI